MTSRPDYLTIVTTVGDRLLVKKLWLEDGQWRSKKSDEAKLLTFESKRVANVLDIWSVWQGIDSHQAVLMGCALDGVEDGLPHRRLLHRHGDEEPTVGPCARGYVFHDIDGLPCPPDMDPTSPDAVRHAIRTVLPELVEIHVVYQHTASAGTTKPDTINVRIGHVVSRPMTAGERIEQWGGRDHLDKSVYETNQLIYLGAPVFEDVADPLGKQRINLIEGSVPAWEVPNDPDRGNGGDDPHFPADAEAARLVAEMADPAVTLEKDGGSRTRTLCRLGRRMCELVKLFDASDDHIEALREAAHGRFEEDRGEHRDEWEAEVDASIRDNITDRVPSPDAHPPQSRPAGKSEDALALRFTAEHGDDLRYVALWGKWMEWEGTLWRKDNTLRVFDLARAVCRKHQKRDAHTVAAVERLAKSDRRHAATTDLWDADPWLFNVRGGTVDLRTGEIRRPLREDYITKVAGTGAPAGDCPGWLAFLRRVAAGDDELVAYLRRVAGYCLTGITSEQVLWFLYGTGANGKSTFLNVLRQIWGDYAAVAPMETFVAPKFGERHSTDIAGLRGARLVVANESEVDQQWAEAKIKMLTGGDPVSARFMRQDFFTYTPQFKIAISGNHRPSLRNVDEAIRRRLQMPPFLVTIPPAERDPDLPDKLVAEAPGILRWAVEGCLEWRRTGLAPPASVVEATNDYLAAEDVLGQWVYDYCETGSPRLEAEVTRLYANYSDRMERAGEHPMSMRKFSLELEKRGFKKDHDWKTRRAVLRGIALRKEQVDRGKLPMDDPRFPV